MFSNNGGGHLYKVILIVFQNTEKRIGISYKYI